MKGMLLGVCASVAEYAVDDTLLLPVCRPDMMANLCSMVANPEFLSYEVEHLSMIIACLSKILSSYNAMFDGVGFGSACEASARGRLCSVPTHEW